MLRHVSAYCDYCRFPMKCSGTSHYERLDESIQEFVCILDDDKDLAKKREDSVRSRVAMDFSGNVGRIVDDPKEAKAIALAEGYSWKGRLRSRPKAQPCNLSRVILQSDAHKTQPWFHFGMSRDQASILMQRHGVVDGVFLVRDSRSNPSAFVLTYKCGGKILHAQIIAILDRMRDVQVFSIDSGVTKFYDLQQLVEFYQLNAGCLPTRLTHYVTKSKQDVENGGGIREIGKSIENRNIRISGASASDFDLCL